MRVNYKVAKTWNELNDWQIKMIGYFMFQNRDKETELTFSKQLVIVVLFLVKPTFKNFIKLFVLLYNHPFSDLLPYADFLFDKQNTLTRFPKSIKVGKFPFRKTLYGPATRLANVTIEELSYADTFYYKWGTTKDLNDLHRLAAIFYRSKSKFPIPEDERVPFNSLVLEANADKTDFIPMHVKFMIAKAYEGCRENFIKRNPHVFPQRKTTEGEEPVEKKPKPYRPFSKIIDSFAMDEVQIFGNHQQVEKVYAPKFLSIYEESIKRQNERERQRK